MKIASRNPVSGLVHVREKAWFNESRFHNRVSIESPSSSNSGSRRGDGLRRIASCGIAGATRRRRRDVGLVTRIFESRRSKQSGLALADAGNLRAERIDHTPVHP